MSKKDKEVKEVIESSIKSAAADLERVLNELVEIRASLDSAELAYDRGLRYLDDLNDWLESITDILQGGGDD